MEIDGKLIFHGVITLMCSVFVWEFYLAIRQNRVYKKHKMIPHELEGMLNEKTFEKARLYALDKSFFNMVNDVFSLVCNIGFLCLNGLEIFWEFGNDVIQKFGFKDNEILQSAVFMSSVSVVSTIVSLPFNMYYTFVLEQKYGFNNQTLSFYLWDKLKMHILYQVILVPLSCATIYIVQIGGDYFFIYLWFFVMAMTLFLYTIYPDYIAPLFDKYTLLPEGQLRTEIEKLAQSVDFPLKKLYVVEGSKRSTHSNAYFYGLFKNKRIVLFDTLLKDFSPIKDLDPNEEKKGCEQAEILAVLGHELGHWKLNHIVKNIIIMQINTLLVFILFGVLFRYQPLYAAFGFTDSRPILIGLIIVLHFVCLPYFEVINFCVTILSRRFEFQADKFSKQLGHAKDLKKALIKLNRDNLVFPIYDPWYSQWHHSHPPLLERLQALDKED